MPQTSTRPSSTRPLSTRQDNHAAGPLREVSSAIAGPGHKTPLRDASRESYLEGMRQAASSVAVVTTDGVAGLHGATVSAFCSVSADPPTLLVCLRSNSRIGDAVRQNGLFTLNILPEDAHATARIFTGEFDGVRPNRFEGVALQDHAEWGPGIQGATQFACKIVRAEVQHTHTIFIGEVVHTASGDLPPLVYHDGDYCRVQRDT